MDKRIRNDRFNKTPTEEVLTYSENIAMHTEEPVVLHDFYEKYGFKHWVEHIYSAQIIYREKPATYSCGLDFERLKIAIASTLLQTKYHLQAKEIETCSSEDEMNNLIIKQYTEESSLYEDVNIMLRKCHNEIIHGDPNLIPWLLQLNIAIRRQKEFNGVCYRDATFTEDEIELYKKRKLFVWAPLVSASKNIDACFGGNVIFRIKPDGAYSMHDKRNGREIFSLSKFPDEEEVIFPIACAYRVEAISVEKDRTFIDLNTIDWN